MLPVLEIESRIVEALREGRRLVLTAPTGSGKTTQVPPMLLRGGLVADGQRIVVLQPRRLAARLVAARVAHECGEALGQTIGFVTRHERQVSAASRIVFMTEGVFLRMLQGDPMLRRIGAVVLDEFHERSIAADMALVLVKQLQEGHRPDLRLVVMSATLDAAAVAEYLQCTAVEAGGRLHAVDVSYLTTRAQKPMWELAAEAVREVVEDDGVQPGQAPSPLPFRESPSEGTGDKNATLAVGTARDVLVFMPGAYEIRRTIEACRRSAGAAGESVALFPLHGSLPAEQQDAAVGSCDRRKVIVATNVAETSITIPGVGHVIDSGLARVHRYDARRGINVLLIEPISQASATQRAGRAGRTAPGTCRRLWMEMEQRGRAAHDTPEILRVDLAEAMLHLLSMGVADVRAFPWYQPPQAMALDRATALLTALGAIDASVRITDVGQTMATFPLHPRLSRMLLAAAQRGCLRRATLWAALISERDITSGPATAPLAEAGDAHASDLAVLERCFEAAARARFAPSVCANAGVNLHAARDVDRAHRQFIELCRRHDLPLDQPGDTDELIKCLLVAYPDHVAVRRNRESLGCAMPGQKRVTLDRQSVAKQVGPLLALDVRELGRSMPRAPNRGDSVETVLSLVSELEASWLAEAHPQHVQRVKQTVWNEATQLVEEHEERRYMDVALDRITRSQVDPAAAADLLVEQIAAGRLQLERWDEKVEQWIARTRFVAHHFPQRQLITYGDDDRRIILHEIVSGATQWSHVKGRPVLDAVRNALSWEEQRQVEELAAAEIALPGGWRMKVAYPADPAAPGARPRGRAKIQDLYGLTDSPRVAAGRVPVLLEILGPNFRPVQVTDDLARFWSVLYPTLRNELRRRYPRHEWR
ncbi:MAG: ATP-dependent helicase HrpB [Phycisphaeraceae bacterium]